MTKPAEKLSITITAPMAQRIRAEVEAGHYGSTSEVIREALRLSGGHAGRAMERLRLPRKTFYDKLTRHGIKPAEFRDDG